jgi:hypothetical protein
MTEIDEERIQVSEVTERHSGGGGGVMLLNEQQNQHVRDRSNISAEQEDRLKDTTEVTRGEHYTGNQQEEGIYEAMVRSIKKFGA